MFVNSCRYSARKNERITRQSVLRDGFTLILFHLFACRLVNAEVETFRMQGFVLATFDVHLVQALTPAVAFLQSFNQRLPRINRACNIQWRRFSLARYVTQAAAITFSMRDIFLRAGILFCILYGFIRTYIYIYIFLAKRGGADVSLKCDANDSAQRTMKGRLHGIIFAQIHYSNYSVRRTRSVHQAKRWKFVIHEL